ncbi:HD domain-containing protein [Roseomonas arctica]|uniref:HD domain-containing protein n=1 Tax=Plastoroseomonas arctica TaxID=1509237 RepID=A0AAF1JVK3_9PROT|nr:HD domain-containing protein [Plastoroseomonas arctica]MBR0654640.1 HD domain-containing protein [Plastoroseomonas arctica]
MPSPHWLPLLREIGNLKRVRSANQTGSVAERLFALAWRRLVAGEETNSVARDVTARALVATRLGDLDAASLHAAGLPGEAVREILGNGFDAAAVLLDAPARRWLRGGSPQVHLDDDADPGVSMAVPAFVERLARQPRAGATTPGRSRLMLEPPENHAEHCLCVAVAAVLLAPETGADTGCVFLASLAHHLHNALLADAGFAGETLLGEWLAPAISGATELALGELTPALGSRVAEACRILPDVETAEGQAFHAADTLDRVLQMEHHLRAASTTMAYLQNEMALVHAGPIKPFQDALLDRMGLAA